MLWFNYVASFSDGMQKVGVTSQPFYRLQDQLLEAMRHGLRLEHFELTEPLANQALAIRVKSGIREKFGTQVVSGHLDWFQYRPADLEPISERDYEDLFRIPHAMRMAVETSNPVDFALSTSMQYYDFCRFAHELGVNGGLIQPATATRLALTLVRPQDQIFAASVAVAHQVEGIPESDAKRLWEKHFEQKEATTNERIQAVLA
jgi:hypothetical protein